MDAEKIEEIRKRATHYKTELYSKVRAEQEEDKTYIDDTFPVPEVKKPHTPIRHGYGRRMVDAPAEEIITSNPQVFVEIVKGSQESLGRISKMFNDWVDILRRQNPNPFKESVKNQQARGETFIQLAHNESWVTSPIGYEKDEKGKDIKNKPIFDRRNLPIAFLVPEPMTIYASPQEDENGMPEEVFTICERQPWEVLVDYPYCVSAKKALQTEGKEVKWLGYYNKDIRHFEADKEIVLSGKNPYGFPPYIRKFSGYGKRSPSGDLADLIVSDIRFSRGFLKDECVQASDLSSIGHLFAHAPVTIIAAGAVNDKSIRENFRLGAYVVNIIDNLGEKFDVRIGDRIQPTPEMYAHYDRTLNQLNQRCPFLMAGFPFGTSGTQQRMTLTEGMRRYLTIIENTNNEWATAFEKAFVILKKIPKLMPKELNKGDLDCVIKCTVKLKASDPVEESRLALMGSRLLTNNEIDPFTNLTEYKGYTQARAMQIIIDMLKWKVILNSPDIMTLIGRRAAEKSGMLEDLNLAKEEAKGAEVGTTIGGEVPPTTRQRMAGEVKTEAGMEAEPEEAREVRMPPGLFNRGGQA